jgi:hypothetical protein
MIELAIPEDFVHWTKIRFDQPIPRYGFGEIGYIEPNSPYPSEYVSLIPRIADWLDENTRLKDRQRIELVRRRVIRSRNGFQTDLRFFLQFHNDRDAVLFKMFFL